LCGLAVLCYGCGMELILLGLISGEALLSWLWVAVIWAVIIGVLFGAYKWLKPQGGWDIAAKVFLVIFTVVVVINLLLRLLH